MRADVFPQSELRDHSYWEQAKCPLVCLVFLTPLLVIYEVGVLLFSESSQTVVRNGADHWMRMGLQSIGLNAQHALPFLIVFGLVGWHFVGRYPCKISTDTLLGMVSESLLFAFCLVVLGQLQNVAFRELNISPDLMIGQDALPRILAFVGAGVYEEVMFRLCLLPMLFGIFRVLAMPIKWAAVLSVLSTSLIFSLAHYVGSSAETLTLFSFTFRSLAGLFFAGLFYFRGFGITVGCHAAYDVIVGFLMELNG